MDGFSKYHFKDLGEDEQIVRVLHRNWFYLFEQFFSVALFGGAFFAGIYFLPALFPAFLGSQYRTAMLFLENSFMLAIWIYSFLIWVDYYFDIWIITTQRIVNIEQKGMFTRKVSEMEYSKMQDITTEVAGFLPTILNFGDVKVQTAGEEEDFIFRTVSDPFHIKNIIVELREKHAHEATDQLGEMIKEKIEA